MESSATVWDVTGISMERRSRRCVMVQESPKAKKRWKRTERIDTKTNELFQGCRTAGQVEMAYEAFWNDLDPRSPHVVKVIDVAPVQ